MKCVILVAGIGSRLGNPFPKCLTPLRPDYSIIDHQLENLTELSQNVVAVVGFKKDLILERHPELLYVYNPRYDQTNTSKSLLCALKHFENEDVLWINGDVVFDARVIPLLLKSPNSCMAVLTNRVAEEEVKFAVDQKGFINAVSKTVPNPLGEAIGINLIRAKDLALFKRCLERCADNDYFEKGLEMALSEGLLLSPVDVTAYPCIEIDFIDDLNRAKAMVQEHSQKPTAS